VGVFGRSLTNVCEIYYLGPTLWRQNFVIWLIASIMPVTALIMSRDTANLNADAGNERSERKKNVSADAGKKNGDDTHEIEAFAFFCRSCYIRCPGI
jgi:hypothetical protein